MVAQNFVNIGEIFFYKMKFIFFKFLDLSYVWSNDLDMLLKKTIVQYCPKPKKHGFQSLRIV